MLSNNTLNRQYKFIFKSYIFGLTNLIVRINHKFECNKTQIDMFHKLIAIQHINFNDDIHTKCIFLKCCVYI